MPLSSQNFLFFILVPIFQHCCQIDHCFPLLSTKLLLSLVKPRRITYVNSINFRNDNGQEEQLDRNVEV